MDICTKCNCTLTIYDAIVRVARSKRPNRPERVFCKDDWDKIRDRFTRRFDRSQTHQMVHIFFAQYEVYVPPTAFPRLPA